MTVVGEGEFKYDMIENWGSLPPDVIQGDVSAIAVDSQDRLYIYQRKDPPINILDREGKYLTSWGDGTVTDPHGIHIGAGDIVYATDRNDHVALKLTGDGKLLLIMGDRGKPSDSGCTEDAVLALRAAGPFNKPTGMVPSPSGDLYVSDGYRNCRVHRFSAAGNLISSWGEPGNTAPNEFFVPHGIWVDKQGLVYACDRDNSRVQVFSATGEFQAMWTDLHRPTAIYMDANETAYVSELAQDVYEDNGQVSVWDKRGNRLARWQCPRTPHWIYGDSRGDLYTAHRRDKRVTKYVKQS